MIFQSGWDRIRTCGGLSPSAVFKTAAFDHSATHPLLAIPPRASLAAAAVPMSKDKSTVFARGVSEGQPPAHALQPTPAAQTVVQGRGELLVWAAQATMQARVA